MKRNHRNIRMHLWFLVAAVIVAVAGCVSPDACAAEPVTLNVWAMGYEGKMIREMADIFEKEYPGQVRVVTQAIPWSGAHEKIMTSIIGGIPPDVCQMGTTWMAEFATIGALEPIEPFLSYSTDVKLEQFFPGALETNRVKGRLYGIPWYVDTRILFYRTDLLKEAGFDRPPETWDEVDAICRALRRLTPAGEIERCGISMAPNDWGEFLPLFWQAGGSLLTEDMSDVAMDSETFREAMQYYKHFFDDKLTPLYQGGGSDMFNAFTTGFYPMFVSGPWMISEVANKCPTITDTQDAAKSKWATAPRAGKKNRKSFIGGCNLVTFTQSKQKEWAFKFIAYMSRPPVQAQWYEITKDLPAARDAWESEALKKNPHMMAFRKQLEWTQAPPNHPSWEQIAFTIQRVQEQIVRGKVSIDEGYDVLTRDIRKIIRPTRADQSLNFKLAICGGLLGAMLAALFIYFMMGSTSREHWSPTHRPIQAVPFLLPALILLAVFLLIPIMTSLVISITNWDIYSLSDIRNLSIVGFDNYKHLLSEDAVLGKAVFNTFIFVLIGVPLTIAISLMMALLINVAFLRCKVFFRTSLFIPVITTMVAVAVIWRWLYNPQFGLINLGLENLGLKPQNWLGDEMIALPSLIVMAVWKNFGYNMVIFLAGLQTIPVVLYEAADIDGVSPWQRFRHITVPMLKPSMIFVVITTVVGYFQFFAEPYIMTEGGPNSATTSIVLHTYNHAFKFYNLGYAAAISYVLFALTLAFSVAQIWYARKSED